MDTVMPLKILLKRGGGGVGRGGRLTDVGLLLKHGG